MMFQRNVPATTMTTMMFQKEKSSTAPVSIEDEHVMELVSGDDEQSSVQLSKGRWEDSKKDVEVPPSFSSSASSSEDVGEDDESVWKKEEEGDSHGNESLFSNGTTSASRSSPNARAKGAAYYYLGVGWRWLGLLGLLATTILSGLRIGDLALDAREAAWKDEFDTIANRLIQNAQSQSQKIQDVLTTYSQTAAVLTSSTTVTSTKWPWVTLPDLDQWMDRQVLGAKDVTLVILLRTDDDRAKWSNYSQTHVDTWLSQDDSAITPFLWKFSNETSQEAVEDKSQGIAAVSWQSTRPVDPTQINFNALSHAGWRPGIRRMISTQRPLVWTTSTETDDALWLQPIIMDSHLVAYYQVRLPWLSFLMGAMNSQSFQARRDTPGLVWIMEDRCNGLFWQVDLYEDRGAWLLQETQFTRIRYESRFVISEHLTIGKTRSSNAADDCHSPLWIHVAATLQFTGMGNTSTAANARSEPSRLAMITGIFVMLLAILAFLGYDFVTRRKHAKMAERAKKSLAIVNSLFPANVRDRLMEKQTDSHRPSRPWSKVFPDADDGTNHNVVRAPRASGKRGRAASIFQSMVESIAIGNDSICEDMDSSPSWNQKIQKKMASRPIADLFPQVSVLFADIAGFTAWSSVREPSQVFTLLESIFETFDGIAKRHKIFKVETIGDCYVAASGLPEPRRAHAIAMCIFARKALHRMGSVVRSLEQWLGLGTSELSIRIGIHSGPIMAGVLRGEKTRFQLFGDTMNTAARIESTGEKNRIHLSQETARLLLDAGKGDWVVLRDEKIVAKGLGELQTYWLTLRDGSIDVGGDTRSFASGSAYSTKSTSPGRDQPHRSPLGRSLRHIMADESSQKRMQTCQMEEARTRRLVDYNTQLLERFLRRVVAMRLPVKVPEIRSGDRGDSPRLLPSRMLSVGSVFEEVQEHILLPVQPTQYIQDPESVVLPAIVKNQLRNYVSKIASMYQANHFHCFEHASHVVMSTVKLLDRVVTPETIDLRDMRYLAKVGSSDLHKYTFGITSDKLAQFAIVLSALVHDVDHSGVPNAQLVKEGDEIASLYHSKSPAEQHSVHLAWDLLMENSFEELRACIYTSQDELDRFRALVVNSVMATDIVDSDLKQLRNARWDKAFHKALACQDAGPVQSQEEANRMATIVIEHLIQASDVSHTMQHWHVYIRWNKRFFRECYQAFRDGRAEKNPLDGWYEGEKDFFDFYVIPLAKKLQECGVFGVSSDEYLNYALANRSEWESKGQQIVEELRLEVVAEQESSSSGTLELQ